VLVSHPIPRTESDAHRVPVIVLDMTDSKKTAGALMDRETQLRTLIDTLPDLVWLKDADGVYLSCNARFERLFGAKEAEIVGKTDYDFVDKDLADFFRGHDRAAMAAGGPSKNEEEIVYADDGHHEVLETIKTPMYGTDGHLMGVLGVGRDITLRKQQEEHILHQAHFDMLTDLPNRFLSLDRLSQLLNDANRTDRRVAVLFLDLDDFKRINDTLGHETGDSLLIEAGDRLRAAVRQGDTVGRLGGDEFIVLLGGLKSAEDAQPVMENLLGCFRDTFRVCKRELIVTASIGAAVYPEDGSNPTELLRNADSAMYHSKGMGRNTYSYFTHSMNSEVSRRFSLEEQMHGALSRGEFYLQYQPQLDIGTRAIVGIEALLRWNNPTLGEIPPTEFIPIAEHTGMIIPIGEFVISEALATLAELRRQHARELRVAVNMSPRQFRDPNLVPYVANAMHTHGLVGCCLEFEITEGVLMGGHSYIDEAFSALTNLGVNLAMDDFGTGYSSLSYLRQYPFDVIKIDRSFVSGITRDSADRELISAAVAMAHGLGLKVVAEGVETEAQLACLTELGCDLVQGYLFSKAVSPDEIQNSLELPVVRSM
jgi:diguanylate cyclase (GGDEF)-like protein/PAS domain S-box-containing protein